MILPDPVLRQPGWRKSMKFFATLTIVGLAVSSLFAALATAQTQPRYTVVDLGVFGSGDNSSANGINNRGWVVGSSNRAPGGPQVAFFWYGLTPFGAYPLISLGTLGGPGSAASGLNSLGEPVVTSSTVQADPNGESFCPGLAPKTQCLGAVWRRGKLSALPTLPGGNNAKAWWINDRGEVVGFSENGIRDETCAPGTPSQVLRFEAVVWDRSGAIHELSPFAGDTVSFAWMINSKGQAVGGSGSCSNTSIPAQNPAAARAVLWDSDGTPIDLGHLEGVPPGVYNLATSINERGEVVGFAQASDGTQHGFLWTPQTGMQDLGGFPGAVNGTGPPCCNTINNQGEIVGLSLDANFNETALIWQNPGWVDLNTLIPADSPWYLEAAQSVNDAGEITGFATLKSACSGGAGAMAWVNNQGDCPVIHAFVAIPR
jgi:probable HAF family extracellular repeat protein